VIGKPARTNNDIRLGVVISIISPTRAEAVRPVVRAGAPPS
jgi:hypothetical protein